MRVLVVYESMYGNTHEVAERIGAGLAAAGEVSVVPVGDADQAAVRGADLVVVGGPTHVHGMSTKMSRGIAVSDQSLERAAEQGTGLDADPDAEGIGLRDWFHAVDPGRPILAAAFDTRLDGPELVTGRASKGIQRRLHHHGYRPVCDPESFLVDEDSTLEDGEADRAEAWSRDVLQAVARVAAEEDGVRPEAAAVEQLDASVESGGRFAPPS